MGAVGGRDGESLILAQLLEEESKDVVKSGATSGAYHCICGCVHMEQYTFHIMHPPVVHKRSGCIQQF